MMVRGRRRLLVVGGGVLGWSVAARLAERGHRVTLATDAADGRSSASAASLAWVNDHGKTPDWYARLNAEARDRHSELSAARPPEQRWFHAVGAVRDGTPLPGDGYVDHITFAAAHRADLNAHGGRVLLGTRVLRLRPERDTVVAETSGCALQADAAVLAAGVGTAELLRGAGSPTGRLGSGIGPEGFLARLSAAALPPVRQLTDADGLRVRPDTGGAVAVQWQDLETEAASEGRSLSATWIWPRLRDGLAVRFGRPVPEDALISMHVAARPMPSDGLPVVGEAAPGIHVLSTHSGMTLAPLLAELAARDIDGDEDPRLRSMRPHIEHPLAGIRSEGAGNTEGTTR